MRNAAARLVFVGICVILAFLLLFKVIRFLLGGIIFAVALLLLGLLPRRTRK